MNAAQLTRQPGSAKGDRLALLGKIHIAKKDLGLDDDTYRGLLGNKFGKTSSAKLSQAQLVALVEHFKSLGWKPKRKAPQRAGTVKMADHAEAGKMRALWISLFHLGVVKDPSEKALSAYAKRLTGGKDTGIASLQWVTAAHAFKVIEGLKKMAEREAGVNWGNYPPIVPSGNVIEAPRKRVIEAQLTLLLEAGVDRVALYEALAPLGGSYTTHRFDYDATALDQTIEKLGALVRSSKKEKSSD